MYASGGFRKCLQKLVWVLKLKLVEK